MREYLDEWLKIRKVIADKMREDLRPALVAGRVPDGPDPTSPEFWVTLSNGNVIVGAAQITARLRSSIIHGTSS